MICTSSLAGLQPGSQTDLELASGQGPSIGSDATGVGMPEQTLEQITEVAPLVRTEAAASESGGRLTGAVVDAIRRAGVFRMAMSRQPT